MAFGTTGTGNICRFGAALLTTTALAAMPSVSFAQTVIDGDDVVSVPGDHPSPWDISGTTLRVGFTAGSDATLDIGVSGVGAGEVTNADATIGFAAGSKGTVNVTGAGSLWESTGLTTIGNQGIGVVHVESGGTVRAAANIIIGNVLGGNGLVVVTGAGSTLSTSTAGIRVGNGAAGSDPSGQLRIEDSGFVSANNVIIGYGSDANGVLTVSGTGSELVVGGGGLVVGRNGTGTLILDDGAELTSNVTSGVGGNGLQIGSGNGSRGTVTISNGAHWNAGARVVRIAPISGREGVLNIGGGVDASGNPLAATGAGTLTANTVILGWGDSQLNFNHTDAAYIFSPEITGGSGTINHFAGTTTIANMEFFDGDVNVFGGRLGGTGSPGSTTGTLTVQDGGTLTPGNSIGTFAAASATFDAGSILEIEINDGGNVAGTHNDLLDVSGVATVNAGTTFRVIAENGADDGSTYTPNTIYTVIRTAAAGNLVILGGGPSITDTFAFLDFTGHDDGQNYYLTSSAVASSFCLPGASFNQCQTGEAVRDLGPGHIAYDAVVGMSDVDANAAFNALSGEIHASGQHILDQSVALFSRGLRARGLAGLGMQALGYSRAPVAGVTDARPPGAWAGLLGSVGAVEDDGNAARLDWRNAGLAGGYEGVIDVASGNAVAGLGFGYIRSHGAVDDRLSTFDADGFYLGAYGAWADGPWNVAGSLSYGANRVSTERNIAFMGTMAKADYWTHTIGLSGEASYAFDLTATTRLAPLFTLDAGRSEHGGFTETGAGALNLTSGSESWTRLDAGLGIALTHVILTETGKVTLEGRAVWEHAFADVVPGQNLTFAGSPTGFTVLGPDAGRDRLRLGAGLSWDVSDDMTLRARYDGLFANTHTDHAASIAVSFRF